MLMMLGGNKNWSWHNLTNCDVKYVKIASCVSLTADVTHHFFFFCEQSSTGLRHCWSSTDVPRSCKGRGRSI